MYFGERKLNNQRQPRMDARRYLDSFAERACDACGALDGTIVPAHIRTGHEGGTGYKPDDDLVLALCFKCHGDQEATPGPWWWVEHVLKRIARNRYARWKAGK
jgi:hypothetical protein